MENIKIDNLSDIISARNWEKTEIQAVVKRIERNIRGARKKTVRLTHLQKKVLNHPDFWGKWENQEFIGKDLIIQGATSAGKTLLSQISILDCLNQNKRALVLVPLKALVHERYKQFVRDFAPNGEYNVYASSSDYLEMDQQLINGEYGIGILVYEKLFSMLCQQDCRILQDCGLIVVDELSMLSKDERGPKLEIALEKAKTSHSAPRILCLTTTDNKVDRIREWLSIAHDAGEMRGAGVQHPEAVAVISSPERPVGLDEYIVTYDGRYKLRRIPGENDSFSEEDDGTEGTFSVPDNTAADSSSRRMALLVEILRNIYREKPDAKTLIFVPSQSGVASIAKKLVDKLPDIFKRIPLETSMNMAADEETAETLLEELIHCDLDEDLSIVKNHLLPYGIAYHHGSMNTTLREVLEGFFRRSPSAKVIVATETLTIGVNMPIDTVIITDYLIPQGQDTKHQLTNQEYRNYIGRAGRNGFSDRGRSYLMLPNNELRTKYWDGKYRQDDQITSALTNASVEEIAPYYLNLLAGKENFDENDVTRMYQSSLSYICNRHGNVNAEQIIGLLQDNLLAQKIRQKKPALKKGKYSLTDIGSVLAAYAFSLETSDLLQYVFVAKYDREMAREFGAGMPSDIKADDIAKDRYLLDILFQICADTEVKNSHLLKLPSLTRSRFIVPEIRGKVYKALYTLLSDKELTRLRVQAFQRADDAPPERCSLWKESAIEKYFFSSQLPDWDCLQQLFRAIIMYYWTQGKTITQIRKIIDLSGYKVRCSGGDLERFAEVVSYHLDAVSRLVQFNNNIDLSSWEEVSRICMAFYNLSNRIKYGIQADAIIVANRHVHGLDRSRIVHLRKAAHEHGIDTLDYLRAAPINEIVKWITRQQRFKLLRLLQNRYSAGSLEVKLRNLEGDYALSSDMCAALRTISSFKSSDPAELFGKLRYVLGNAPEGCLVKCAVLTDTQNPCIQKWSYVASNGDSAIYIAYLYTDEDGTIDDAQRQQRISIIKDFFMQNATTGCARILVSGSGSIQPLYDAQSSGIPFTLGITCENLATLVLSSIWLGKGATSNENGEKTEQSPIVSKGSAELLFEVLQDACGIQINLSLSNTNYTLESYNGDPKYQILMNQDAKEGAFCQQICNRLLSDERLNRFRVLPWGEALNEKIFVDHPTIILLTPRQIQSSRSLTTFMYRMGQSGFQNCMIMAEDQAEYQEWINVQQQNNSVMWYNAISRCPVRCMESVNQMKECIQRFVDGWKRKEFLIGVSYAHYDGTVCTQKETCESDIAALKKLVMHLNNIYGEQRVLFDENPTCIERGLFVCHHDRAQEAYQECKLVIVLDNIWTRSNDNCNDEQRWVQKEVDEGKADIWYLQTANSQNPTVRAKVYTTLLSQDDILLDQLVQSIRSRVAALSKMQKEE